MADLALAVEEGVVSTSPPKLTALYKKYDQDFPVRLAMTEKISQALDVVRGDLSSLRDTYVTKPHILHSLVCALIHNRFGLPNVENDFGIPSDGQFFADKDVAVNAIRRLALAHEEKDGSEFGEYVGAALEGGNRATQRAVRLRWLSAALQGQIV
jgi:hypothetical protein